MRMSPILLLAAATLLLGCNAISSAADTKLLMMSSHDAVPSSHADPVKSSRFLRNANKEMVANKDDLDSEDEERAGTQLAFIDDLLAKIAVNEAVALKNLTKFDDDLMQKLRQNPSWARKIHGWKEAELDPTAVANLLKEQPSLSRKYSKEWNAWKIYAAQYLRLAQGLQ